MIISAVQVRKVRLTEVAHSPAVSTYWCPSFLPPFPIIAEMAAMVERVL